MLHQTLFRTVSHAALRVVAIISGAKALAAGESDALALDFTDDSWQAATGFYGSAYIVDTGTPANDYDTSPTTTASSLLTYTSPSPKMCMGPSGLLRYGAHNLYVRSEEADNASWTKNGTTASANTIAAADGTTIADTITENSASSIHEFSQSQTLVNGATYALTMEIKNASGTRWVRMDAAGAAHTVSFDPVAGTVGTTSGSASGTAVDLGNGWWRFTMTWTAATGSSANYGFRLTASNGSSSTYLGDGASGVYVAKMHLRRTPSDSTYLATTTAARYALPLEWNSAGVAQGLLVEEARTNICLRSSDLTNASWTASNVTTAKTATGPDGVANSATTLTATAGNGTVLQAITSASAARITSCYIKRRTGSGTVEMTQDNGSTWSAVTVTADWTRVNIASATLTNPTVGLRIVTSADAVDVALFQHEVGSFTTSPIETFASTVTRAADNISLATSAFPYGTSNTLFFWGSQVSNSTATAAHIQIDDGTTSNRNIIAADQGFTGVGGVAQAQIATTEDVNTNKYAYAFATNDFAFAKNSTVIGTDASGSLPTVTTLRLNNNTSLYNTGMIKQIACFPRRMSNAELQTLTT